MERELEVKVLGIDLDEMEKRIVSLGGKLIAKEKQTNTLIDSRDRPIKAYIDAYLRIRETKDLIGHEENIVFTLKKSIDKSINSLNRNTQEIEAVLNTLTEVDKDTISPNDKKELERKV